MKKMVDDAKDHAEEDHRRREEAETRNRADEVVYSTEKSLRELGDKVDADEKAKIESALDEVKEALKGSDVQKIKATMENLVQASHKLAEAVYAQASAEAGGGAPAGGVPGEEAGPDEEEVIDADYEVMDDEQD